ncbi:MAG TPA: SDR family NAD(P)-dependent oxidoreductase [Nocardioidaceae bacterium]|nr:SDR family NAD(P)-dependent oxidoreductase [Nocardioidaceae bacterium]
MPAPDTRPLAVVTGASSGIGLELAKQFAQHDYDLVLAAEDTELNGATRECESLGASVQAVQVDLATYDGVERLASALHSLDRPVEALAVNAGVGVGGEFVDTTNLEDELRLINLNVVSSVHLAKRVLPDMVQRGRGRVLFTSSIAAMMPATFQVVYGASKSFVQSFSEGLREELKDTGVSVTALMPGPTETEFFERADLDDTRVGAADKDDAAQVARQGFDALMAGKEKVLAGSITTRAMSAASKGMPDRAKAKMHAKMSEPGSADS